MWPCPVGLIRFIGLIRRSKINSERKEGERSERLESELQPFVCVRPAGRCD